MFILYSFLALMIVVWYNCICDHHAVLLQFAGFSAESLAERMQDGEVNVLITTGTYVCYQLLCLIVLHEILTSKLIQGDLSVALLDCVYYHMPHKIKVISCKMVMVTGNDN